MRNHKEILTQAFVYPFGAITRLPHSLFSMPAARLAGGPQQIWNMSAAISLQDVEFMKGCPESSEAASDWWNWHVGDVTELWLLMKEHAIVIPLLLALGNLSYTPHLGQELTCRWRHTAAVSFGSKQPVLYYLGRRTLWKEFPVKNGHQLQFSIPSMMI